MFKDLPLSSFKFFTLAQASITAAKLEAYWSQMRLVCRWLRTLPAAWWGLKICSSERDVPLVGVAIWAAERVVQANSECAFAFPRYNQSDVTVANSASAALNKLLKQYVLAGCKVHSFRHSMRDRLRAVECLSKMIDRIGVWPRTVSGKVMVQVVH